MSHWDSTYEINRVAVSDGASADVWTAISDMGNLVGTLEIDIRVSNGHSRSSIALTSEQMKEVAWMLNRHANRLDVLKHELDYLQTKAA